MASSLRKVAFLAIIGVIICSSFIFEFGDAQGLGGAPVQIRTCTENAGTCRTSCREGEEQMGTCDWFTVCCVTKDPDDPDARRTRG